jgi:hypothetical protein
LKHGRDICVKLAKSWVCRRIVLAAGERDAASAKRMTSENRMKPDHFRKSGSAQSREFPLISRRAAP